MSHLGCKLTVITIAGLLCGQALGATQEEWIFKTVVVNEMPSLSDYSGVAECPVGKKVLAGGFQILGARFAFVPVENGPTAGEGAWRVDVYNRTVNKHNLELTIHARCAIP